jgi:hypothetical protein
LATGLGRKASVWKVRKYDVHLTPGAASVVVRSQANLVKLERAGGEEDFLSDAGDPVGGRQGVAFRKVGSSAVEEGDRADAGESGEAPRKASGFGFDARQTGIEVNPCMERADRWTVQNAP